MDPQDRAASLAARIADGSGIDWGVAASAAASADDRALLDELRTIADVATLHRAPTDWQPESVKTWGPLTILSPIGRGRFGDVYVAWDARLQRRVALKLLPATSSVASPTRAIEEARLLARVRHDNVLTVYGAEVLDDRVGIWTEFIEGQTLEALLAERGPLEPDEVIGIGVDLCRALATVHDAGLLHRDIKAQNVMRETGGRIVLMDFGAGHDLALAPVRDGDLTGTPLYLAPETFGGAAASRVSDLYAIGVLLFHLLTGAHPITGRTLEEVRRGHARGAFTRLRDLRPELTSDLIAVIERALAVKPADRFQRATELADALDSLRTHAGHARTHPAARRGRPRVWMALAVSLLIIVGAISWVTSTFPSGRERRADPANLFAIPAGDSPQATFTRLKELENSSSVGRPSRDGRFLPFVDLEFNVQIWDLEQGTARRVPNVTDESAESTLMSPDGTRLVYAVLGDSDGYELRIVDADGTAPRVLIPKEAAVTVRAYEWSRDGQRILCALQRSDGTTLLALVHVNGGTRELHRLRHAIPKHASLSPDGQFAVYDAPRASTDPIARDIFIVRTDDSPEPPRLLLSGSAMNLMPLWLADGRVFFVSDRSGSLDGWIVPVVAGMARGEPVHVAEGLGRIAPLGLTDDGRLIFGLTTGRPDVYTARIDQGVVSVATRALVSPVFAGRREAPSWSRDGEYLSYLTKAGQTPLDRDVTTLTIQQADSGNVRELPPDEIRPGRMTPVWSPDRRHLLVRGRYTDGRQGYFAVDAATGRSTPLLSWPREFERDYGAFAWALDGRILYLHRPTGVVARDRAGREEVIAPKGTREVGHSLVVSPDGTQIAFTSMERRDKKWETVIEVADLRGPNRRDIVRSELVVVQGWTTDNRIVYTTVSAGGGIGHHLWSIDSSGLDRRDMGLTVDGDTRLNKMSLRGDGRRVAFTEGGSSQQLWMLEQFLPARGPERK